MTRAGLRAAARQILRAGLTAVEPGHLIRTQLRVLGSDLRVGGAWIKHKSRVFVVSAGKAAVPMARAALEVLGRRMTSAIVIAPEKAPRWPRTVSFVSGHPIPDAAGLRAGQRVIELLSQAERNDLVLLLLSGGASALMPAPIEGVSLREKQRMTRLLLRRGAAIGEINAVRSRLSRLKGGGFARLAAPARVVTLALSDVPGDDKRVIGSGPAVEDRRAPDRARQTLRKFFTDGEVPLNVARAINRARAKARGLRARTVVVGGGRTFARAAGEEARRLGFKVQVRADALQGEARRCGPALVAMFERRRGREPRCLIATGETVVKVLGPGTGGRNQELALSAVPALARFPRPTVLAAFATDGRDGTSWASGGLVDDRTAQRALDLGVSVEKTLARNDSTRALKRLRGLVVTGVTGTNVADVAVLLG